MADSLRFVSPSPSQAMESKLLVGGKNIIDHTNEQQKMLETKRQEIAEQVNLLTSSINI